MPDLPSIELRPGVRRPDWSVVTKPAVRDALLRKASSRPGLIAKWSTTLLPDQDLLWRTVVEQFAAVGRAPRLTEIAQRLNMPEQLLLPVLRALHDRDLLGLDATSDAVAFAYPFAGRESGHAVELQGRRVHALCAIDALGAGAMCGVDTIVESTCRLCSAPIKILTKDSGKAVYAASPTDPVVWYDHAYDQNAASSCCPSIAFFCTDDHLQRWRTAQGPERSGSRLTLDEALEAGRAIFEPILRRTAIERELHAAAEEGRASQFHGSSSSSRDAG